MKLRNPLPAVKVGGVRQRKKRRRSLGKVVEFLKALDIPPDDSHDPMAGGSLQPSNPRAVKKPSPHLTLEEVDLTSPSTSPQHVAQVRDLGILISDSPFFLSHNSSNSSNSFRWIQYSSPRLRKTSPPRTMSPRTLPCLRTSRLRSRGFEKSAKPLTSGRS